MNIARRNSNGAEIINVSGHIDMGSSPALRKALLDCLKTSERLALNLAAVKYIDSSGIASLLEVLKEARSRNKKFVLFGLAEVVLEVLHLTRLTGVFEIYETEEAAVEIATRVGGAT